MRCPEPFVRGGEPPRRRASGGASSDGRDWYATAAAIQAFPGEWYHADYQTRVAAQNAAKRLRDAVQRCKEWRIEQHDLQVWVRYDPASPIVRDNRWT